VVNYWSSFTSSHDSVEVVTSNKGKEKMGGATPVFATSQEQVGWKPPPDDYIKINVDASYVESISAAMWGWLLGTHLVKLLFLRGTFWVSVAA